MLPDCRSDDACNGDWSDFFRRGYQLGFKPSELLDLELYQYNACILGAADRQRDQVAIAVQGAYYTAYWNNAKHPKSLQQVIKKIYQDDNTPKPDVNVDEFLERKRRFEQSGGFASNKDSIIPIARQHN